MPPCICSDCGGADQSRSTVAAHMKARDARQRLTKDFNVDSRHDTQYDAIQLEKTLIGSLSTQSEWESESPLWRGRKMPLRRESVEAISNDEVVGSGALSSPDTEQALSNSGPILDTIHFFDSIQSRLSCFSFPDEIVFAYPPSTQTSMYPGHEMTQPWDEGPAGLRRDCLTNAALLLHITYLHSLTVTLSSMQVPLTLASRKQDILRSVHLEMESLEAWRMSAWMRQQEGTPDPGNLRRNLHVVRTDMYLKTLKNGNPLVQLCTFLVVALNVLFNLTLPGCRLALKVLKAILKVAHADFSRSRSPIPNELEKLLDGIPADVSTAINRLNIEPDSIVYACCPDCFALYLPQTVKLADSRNIQSLSPPDDAGVDHNVSLSDSFDLFPSYYPMLSDSNTIPQRFPLYCVNRETMESVECGARLLRPQSSHRSGQEGVGHRKPRPSEKDKDHRPILTYSYQPLASWIGRLLARQDIERVVNTSMLELSRNTPDPAYVEDILESSEIKHFSDNEGKVYLRCKDDEARLIFSLFVDWFNPRGNKKAGASISSGVIFMACLNLPPEVRYKRENIYLAGVMPGPKAPSLQQINHFLRPLVADLLVLWNEGIYLSHTTLYPRGRLVRAAVIPLVCDLGAVRKTSGQASHSAAFFCSYCQLMKRDINEIDPAKWPRRDCATFRRFAEAWHNAPNETSRKKVFKAHGVRYSVLLQLPYWKPTKFVTLDTMHNLFLGLFQRHCRKVFGMSIQADESLVGEDGLDLNEAPPVSLDDLQRAVKELERCSNPNALKRNLNVPIMQALYQIAGCGVPEKRTKQQMADILSSCGIHQRHEAIATATQELSF